MAFIILQSEQLSEIPTKSTKYCCKRGRPGPFQSSCMTTNPHFSHWKQGAAATAQTPHPLTSAHPTTHPEQRPPSGLSLPTASYLRPFWTLSHPHFITRHVHSRGGRQGPTCNGCISQNVQQSILDMADAQNGGWRMNWKTTESLYWINDPLTHRRHRSPAVWKWTGPVTAKSPRLSLTGLTPQGKVLTQPPTVPSAMSQAPCT
jgi:hypothetical protein